MGYVCEILAALRGFEPRLPESESGVLPLDERATFQIFKASFEAPR